MNKLEINPNWSGIVTAANKVQLNPDKLITDDEGNIVGCFVGDRFYNQQLKAIGKAPGVKGQKPDRVLKADVVASLPVIAGLSKLTQKDLAKLPEVLSKKYQLELPTGRLKAPYISALKALEATVDWNKLTIATMAEVLKYVKQEDLP